MLAKADLQRLRSLRDKKTRESLGLFVVEGEKVVRELLAANFLFTEIYTTSTADFTPPPSVRYIELTPAEMARASHFPTPSSVLAVGPLQRVPLAPAALDHGLTLALDGVQDAGNVGTLLRLADWFARVITHTADLAAALASVAPSTPVLGCDLTGDDVHALPALRDAIIVIGSEGRGLSPAVAALVTRRITISRYGAAESLNAATAAAIVCDNLRRLHPGISGQHA